MIPALKFNIRNQNIQRVDSFLPVKNSKNYLYAEFNFLTEDWNEAERTAIFNGETLENPIPVLLLSGSTCLVPHEVLKDDYFTVTLIGGDRITTDEWKVKVYDSGYREDATKPPDPDAYSQLVENVARNTKDIKTLQEDVKQLQEGGASSGYIDEDGYLVLSDNTIIDEDGYINL